MLLNHAVFASSPALRASLKRGIARQAIVVAGRAAPDLHQIFRTANAMRPNPKALERVAARIRRQRGVVRVATAPAGRSLSLLLRMVREVEARVDGETLFHETGLIYLGAVVTPGRGRPAFGLRAVGFCVHALERLIERTQIPLDAGILPVIDAEARGILAQWDADCMIEDGGDAFFSARSTGVWAGGHDRMGIGPDWGLAGHDGA